MAGRKTNGGKSAASKTDEKALAVPKNALMIDDKSGQPYIPINFNLVLEGDAADDNEPIVLAAMKLLASTSKEVQNEVNGAKAGLFYNTLTMDFHKKLVALPLYRYIERYMSLTPGEMGSPIVCASRDGRGQYGLCSANPVDFGIPVVRITDKKTGQQMPVGNCETCPNKDFQTDQTGTRQKPKCREVHYVVCLDQSQFHTDDEFVQALIEGDTEVIGDVITNLYAVPFSRTSLATVRKVRNMNRLSGGQWFARWWEFTPDKTGDGNNTWWTIVAKPMQGLDKNGKLIARSLSKFVEQLRGFDKLHAALDEAAVSEFDSSNDDEKDVEVEVK